MQCYKRELGYICIFQRSVYMKIQCKDLIFVTKGSRVLARLPMCFDDAWSKTDNCKVRVTRLKLVEVKRKPRNDLVKVTWQFVAHLYNNKNVTILKISEIV